MDRAEVLDLLTTAAAYDGRRIADGDVLAWHELLRDVEFADAGQVLAAHYARDTRRITPADVRQGVRFLRERRLARGADQPPEVDPDDVTGYIRGIADAKRALADGLALPAVPAQPAPPPPEIIHRPGRSPEVVAALSVACPWCRARPGHPCTTPRVRRELRTAVVHPSRLEAGRTKEST